MSFNEDYDDDLDDLDLSVDSSDEDQYDNDDTVIDAAEPEHQAEKKPTRAEKRINELTWKAKSAEERAEIAEQTANELARRLAEINEAKSSETLQALEAEKVEALEIGDHSRVVEIDRDLMQAYRGENKPPIQQPVAQQPAQPEVAPEQAAWMARNQDILGDPDKVAKTDRIIQHWHNNALWKQLDKNIHRVRPPAQAGNGVGGSDSGNGSTQGLNRADIEHIKELGYDYKDKAVQQTYLKSKRSAANGRA
jgi:plasmid maintenance system killer protein